MPLYQAQCNHDGLYAGQVYDLDERDVEYRAGAIEAGFLIPSEDHWAGASALDWPEPALPNFDIVDHDADEPADFVIHGDGTGERVVTE